MSLISQENRDQLEKISNELGFFSVGNIQVEIGCITENGSNRSDGRLTITFKLKKHFDGVAPSATNFRCNKVSVSVDFENIILNNTECIDICLIVKPDLNTGINEEIFKKILSAINNMLFSNED